ncbi:zf-HC2 domain-containing protein [Gemmatimonas sp.]|uniref:zf-HC2 domain-containing protein n=1 Tax=Gemmatimonas sp. TaxID=1962908 RepID=UPI00356A2F19
MTECRTPEMQDLLPDYVSASLDTTAAALVKQHLSICDPCRDDIAVLRLARAVRPKAVTLNVALIVANLPRPTPVLRLVRSSTKATPIAAASAMASSTTVSRPRRRWSASVWQVAAAVGVMIVGGTSLIVSRSSPNSLTSARSREAQLAEAAESALVQTTGAAGTIPSATVARLDSSTSIGSTTRVSRVSVSYGDLGDYSEAELQHMLDRLEKWDGTSSSEPLPTLPVVSTSGGSAK